MACPSLFTDLQDSDSYPILGILTPVILSVGLWPTWRKNAHKNLCKYDRWCRWHRHLFQKQVCVWHLDVVNFLYLVVPLSDLTAFALFLEFFLVFWLSTLRFCEIVQFASRRCVLAWQPILSTIRISGGSCHFSGQTGCGCETSASFDEHAAETICMTSSFRRRDPFKQAQGYTTTPLISTP